MSIIHFKVVFLTVILLSQASLASLRGIRETLHSEDEAVLVKGLSCLPECFSCSNYFKFLRNDTMSLTNLWNQLKRMSKDNHNQISITPRNKTCNKNVCGCKKVQYFLSPVANENISLPSPIDDLDICPEYSKCFRGRSSCPKSKHEKNMVCPHLKEKNRTKTKRQEMCPDDMTWENNCIKIVKFASNNIFAVWTKRDLNGYIDFSVNREFCFPQTILVTSGILQINLFCENSLVSQKSIPINGEDYCTIKECSFICMDYLTHYLCYSLTTQILLGLAFTISALLFLILILYLIYKCCYQTSWHQSAPFVLYEMKNKIGNLVNPNIPVDGDLIKMMDEDLENKRSSKIETNKSSEPKKVKSKRKFSESLNDQSDSESGSSHYEGDESGEELKALPKRNMDNVKIKISKKSPGPRIGSLSIASLLCLFCLITIAQAECISYSVVSTNVASCKVINNVPRCNLKINTFGQIRNLGQSLCLTFTDQDGIYIGNLTISYTMSTIKAPLKLEYWTTDYRIEGYTVKHCPVTQNVCEDKSCSCVGINDVSFFPPEIAKYPGYTLCESVAGCAANGCFFCDMAELLTRQYMIQIGFAHFVNSIGPLLHIPEIVIQHCFNNTCKTASGPLDEPIITDGIQVSLTSVGSRRETIDFKNNHIFGNPLWSKMYPFSPRGVTVRGSPGDVQTDYKEWIIGPEYYWNYPGDPAYSSISEDKILIAQFPSGLAIATHNGLNLPGYIQGIYWDTDPNYIYGVDPSPGAISVFITTPNEISISFTQGQVCPKIDSITGNGCFNCEAGATLKIFAYSECDEGNALLKTTSANDIFFYRSSIFLSKSKEMTIVAFEAKQKIVDINVTLKSLQFQDSYVVRVILEDPPLLDYFKNNYTISNGTQLNSNDLFTDWWNGLNGPMAVVKWVVAVILIITIVSVFIGIVYSIIKCYLDSRVVYSQIQ